MRCAASSRLSRLPPLYMFNRLRPSVCAFSISSLAKPEKNFYWICLEIEQFHSFTGGASYSPEYYINIRTGIHYFPKGNATVDPATNRFKSGLNRIEEKHDEVVRRCAISADFNYLYRNFFIVMFLLGKKKLGNCLWVEDCQEMMSC